MKNKTLWTDTEGKPIQAHGGMILQHKGIYYWYGENKDTETVTSILLVFPVTPLKTWKTGGMKVLYFHR